jgi:hypothetical protein
VTGGGKAGRLTYVGGKAGTLILNRLEKRFFTGGTPVSHGLREERGDAILGILPKLKCEKQRTILEAKRKA